ncbi:MAG: hypothetical protein LBI73_02755 [Myroides sp.]|jgi:hypothetical protein|nr:hypothetical protein [Myroides sp.]
MSDGKLELKFKVVNVFIFISIAVMFILIILFFYIKTITGSRLLLFCMFAIPLSLLYRIRTTFTVSIDTNTGGIKEIHKSKKVYTYETIKNIQIINSGILKGSCYFLVFNNMLYIIDILEAYENPMRKSGIVEQSRIAFVFFQRAIDISEEILQNKKDE